MRNWRGIPFEVLILSCLLSGSASGHPSSLTLRTGYVAYENFTDDTHPISLAISPSWNLGKQTAFWSSVGYVQERFAAYRVLSEVEYSPLIVRTHLVPVSAGLRAYANDARHHSRGLFLEIGPSLGGASYIGSDGGHHLAALCGFQCGMGVRFAGIDGSRFELGGSYQMAEALGKYSRSIGRIGTEQDIDYHIFSAYVGLGFGN